jgi:microsomal dipeptidase-like Zn-dependent dipeptidase
MADINIYGTLKTMAGDGKAVVASQVFDVERGKFQDEINNETDNEGLVSAKMAQSFTTTEKAQARTNIDALGSITQQEFNAIFND